MIAMNIHELQSKLLPLVGEGKIFDAVTKVSHWMQKIRDEKEYVCRDDKEIEVITKFAELGIVKLERKGSSVVATLTEPGKQLHREFVARGYYL